MKAAVGRSDCLRTGETSTKQRLGLVLRQGLAASTSRDLCGRSELLLYYMSINIIPPFSPCNFGRIQGKLHRGAKVCYTEPMKLLQMPRLCGSCY